MKRPSNLSFARVRAVVAVAACAWMCASANAHAQVRVLDAFDDPSSWRVLTSNQVSGSLRSVDGVDGKALCLDYDFNGVSGYASLQRDLPMDYPSNYRFAFRMRGDSPANDLQFKLFDASGDNVWWVNRPRHAFPAEWTPVVYKRRHIDKAWGPSADRVLRKSARLEYTIYNSVGGKGSVCFDALTFEILPDDDASPLRATARARRGDADAIVDGDASTAWKARAGDTVTLDLGSVREFGGVTLDWMSGKAATLFDVALSDDGTQWRDARAVSDSRGARSYVALPESTARYLRIRVDSVPRGGAALAAATVQPLEFAATNNDLLKSVARDVPRGAFPRGFIGEQPYWTLVGIDGGHEQGLIGEDGAIELRRGGASIAPMVRVADDAGAGRWITWADATLTPSLQDDYLPIPSVDWVHDDFGLRVTAFADGTPGDARLVGRYRLTNRSDARRRFTLALALHPWQVNPPSQFLNTTGGFSPLRDVSVDADRIRAGERDVIHMAPGSRAGASTFPQGLASLRLMQGDKPAATHAQDADGLASAAWSYEVELAPGESREFWWWSPLEGAGDARAFDVAAAQERVAATWRASLDRVRITVPAEGQPLVDTLRTSLAHMLVSRIGPRLQPGTRSYSRSWIRDGAMISEGLLRMGRDDVARNYVRWYAPYQFKDGMVPCCVDDRGSDPVPENDSHGELIYAIADYYRYSGDREFLQSMWPHVQGAFGYMEKLRASERTQANRARNAAFYGMMPISISHEGYSAKPVHSYWDNFWALRGYKDAAEMALRVGTASEQRQMRAARDEFRADLEASLLAATRAHGIDFLPGSAELGDFDATSTTIALAPGGEQGRLPATLLDTTFQRYWTQFVERRDGLREWKDYTPYEWRNVAAFVRLGWRERAWEVVQFFFKDRGPPAWNQWAEVVSRTPRTPFFVGDLPHAWVGSDFVRSALDMFAYTREIDDSIVLAAGIPATWFDGRGIAIEGLRTPNGTLSYAVRREGAQLHLDIPAGLRVPKGGLVLPWPYHGEPGAARVDGKTAAWRDRELRITRLPARVVIDVPPSE